MPIEEKPYSFMSNGEFGLKTNIKNVWDKMSREEKFEYLHIKDNGVEEDGFIIIPLPDFVRCLSFCRKMNDKYGK